MNVIANDSDADNDLISITGIKSNPANGKAIVNSNNNTITYSPDPNFNGQDSLKYTITDSHEGNSTTQVTVDVLPVNDNPIARPDSAVTLQDKSVVVDVLANDSDADKDPLTISQLTTPTHGGVCY